VGLIVNRPLKGTYAEKVVKAIWEREGYVVHQAKSHLIRTGPPYCPNCRQPLGPVFADSNDIWRAIDLVGMHPLQGFRFAQVTTISGKSGSLSYGSVYVRKKKIEALPWPKIPWSHGYAVEIWGARNQRIGREAARWFQVWDYFVDSNEWKLLRERVPVSGPVPGVVSNPAESAESEPAGKSPAP
jgi:hypothetical protein